MLDWYWRVIVLKIVFALSFFVCNIRAHDAVKKLPFCDPNYVRDTPGINDLVIVSTLDGRLSAFFTHNGNKAWTLETKPLLSSNLHKVELTSGEKWMRLVPSLNGSLYSLSEDSIEQLPIDTVQLMSSSFKFSDGRVLVIGGARETTWLGIDTNTGRVVYECGTAGCNNEQETAGAGRDVLVLRRQSNTVRALDPRTGTEKWSFSVAEHMIALSPRECVGTRPTIRIPVNVDVGLPDGVVSVTATGGDNFSWQKKLDAPVAGMWRFHSGTVQNIDIMREATPTLVQGGIVQQPTLYIGVHDKQIYIQESQFYSKKLDTAVSTQHLPWKLVTASPQIASKPSDSPLTTTEPSSNALALISLYDNVAQSDAFGFFVYQQETCDQSVQVTDDVFDSTIPNSSDDQSEHQHIHVHISSLWYWWKEVLLIAVSSALLMNLMIWPRFFAPKIRAVTPLPTVNQEQMVLHMSDWYLEKSLPKVPEYSSRFVNDFTVVRLLGKGGFGVVYEAINNIDHCSYAVKIITLPRKQSKRERVLREVRALAKLEHEHIVRYFNAWVEEPPSTWKHQRDAVWMRELDGTLAMTEDYTATSQHAPNKNPLRDVKLDLNKCSEPSKRQRTQSCNDSFSIVFDENAPDHLTKSYSSKIEATPNSFAKPPVSDDDSFIVFANSEHPDSSNVENTGNVPTNGHSSFETQTNASEQAQEGDYKTETSMAKKKKGHVRHWSLGSGPTPGSSPGGSPRKYLFIQMQLCRPDSLHDWLRQNSCDQRLDQVNTLFSQIVSAVEYVHLAGLIHRDLKPRNILFAQDGRVKVGDFGLVTAMNDTSQDGEPPDVIDAGYRHTYKVGTHLYMSPEQLLGHPYNYKVDIYSLGLILFELLHPFGTESERISCILKLREGNYPQDFHQKYPKEMEVLKMMLSAEPSKRPTATGVRARAPLYHQTDHKYHFALPAMDTHSRQRDI